MLQRVAVALMLVRLCVIQLTNSPFSTSMIPHVVGGCAAPIFLVGLWTPVVGALIAILELWIALTHLGDPWIPIILAIIGGSSAMLGPGAFSIDARLFGRRHLEL